MVQPLFSCNRWLLLELAPALLLSYVLRDQVHRIAARTLISNKKEVPHELQVGDEDRLYVFFDPRLDLRPLRLSRSPQKDENCSNNLKVATDLDHGCDPVYTGSLPTNLYGHHCRLVLLVVALEVGDLVVALEMPDAGGDFVDQIVVVRDQQHRTLIPL